jgi:hypothetical protein
MSTRGWHYEEAERLIGSLDKMLDMAGSSKRNDLIDSLRQATALAQVHATLASVSSEVSR